MTLLGCALPAVAIPSIGEAQTGDFVHSANGPGSGRTTVNLGVRTYVPSLAEVNVVLPTVDLNVVYGINRTLDYELRVSTIGLLSLIDTGVKFRIVGDHAIALGGRLDATGLLVVAPGDDEIRKSPSLSARRKERLLSPGFFGKLVYVFDERHVMVVYDGECSRPIAYRYQLADQGRVQLLLLNPDPEQDAIIEIERVGDEYRVPMEMLDGIKEIFLPVAPDDVRDVPCIAERLAPRPLLDRDAAAVLAARLANDECDRKYAVRPFTPEDWPIAEQDGHWSWGEVDPLGPNGYSVVVTFEADGTLPLVRVYKTTDGLELDRADPFFMEEPE
jgi:hypothetical protein